MYEGWKAAMENAKMYEVFKKADGKWAFKTPHGLETRNTKTAAVKAAAQWAAADTKI